MEDFQKEILRKNSERAQNIIKSFVDSENVSIPKKEFISEHENLVDVLESDSHKDDAKEAKKQKKELDEVLQKARQVGERKVGPDGITRVWSQRANGNFGWRRVKKQASNKNPQPENKPTKTVENTKIGRRNAQITKHSNGLTQIKFEDKQLPPTKSELRRDKINDDKMKKVDNVRKNLNIPEPLKKYAKSQGSYNNIKSLAEEIQLGKKTSSHWFSLKKEIPADELKNMQSELSKQGIKISKMKAFHPNEFAYSLSYNVKNKQQTPDSDKKSDSSNKSQKITNNEDLQNTIEKFTKNRNEEDIAHYISGGCYDFAQALYELNDKKGGFKGLYDADGTELHVVYVDDNNNMYDINGEVTEDSVENDFDYDGLNWKNLSSEDLSFNKDSVASILEDFKNSKKEQKSTTKTSTKGKKKLTSEQTKILSDMYSTGMFSNSSEFLELVKDQYDDEDLDGLPDSAIKKFYDFKKEGGSKTKQKKNKPVDLKGFQDFLSNQEKQMGRWDIQYRVEEKGDGIFHVIADAGGKRGSTSDAEKLAMKNRPSLPQGFKYKDNDAYHLDGETKMTSKSIEDHDERYDDRGYTDSEFYGSALWLVEKEKPIKKGLDYQSIEKAKEILNLN